MRILLFGSTGKVGKELRIKLFEDHHDVTMVDRAHMDLEKPGDLYRRIRETNPEIIINAAAYNGVENCEKNPEKAFLVNAAAPAIMASASKLVGARFIHFSTDYVFQDGGKDLTEHDIALPRTTYGWTKAYGDNATRFLSNDYYIFRVSCVYGRDFTGPLDPIAQAVKNNGHAVDIPINALYQYCAPTSARLIAHAVAHTLTVGRRPSGIYNLSTSQGVWRRAFVRHVLNKKLGERSWAIEEINLPNPRPEYSVMNCTKFEKTFGYTLPNWMEDFDTVLPLLKGT